MKRAIFGCLSVAALSFPAVAVFAAEPRLEEFAYRASIALSAPGSVYRAPLPAHVYQNLTRGDLGDLRVYNGAGEIVSHTIARTGREPHTRLVELPIFPVPRATVSGTADVSMFVATAPGGSVVALQAGKPDVNERWAYIVDASQIEGSLAALEIAWAEAMPAEQFIASLVIEASDDLKQWRTLGQGAVASLTREAQVLEQRRIALSPQRVKYVRLSWAEPSPKVSIVGIKAELREQTEPARDWVALRPVEATRNEYRFELDGRMPIDRARLPLGDNSVARVSVYSRARTGDPWLLRGQKNVFAVLSDGRELKDNEIPLQGINSDRQWLLRLEDGSNGLGSSTPVIELGWVPHELVFVARGSEPYALAYGNVRATAAIDPAVDELLRRSKREDHERVQIRLATISGPSAVRGDAARVGAWHANWQRWLLWAVLATGVGLLVLLAFRIKTQLTRLSD